MEKLLIHQERCVICVKDVPRTVDHVFPERALKDHSYIFDQLVGNPLNWVILCRPDHDFVDFGDKRRMGKMTAYSRRGMVGLVKSVANYPATAQSLQITQGRQWIKLFENLRDGIDQNGFWATTSQQEEYAVVLPLVNKYLDRWSNGVFRGVVLEELDLLN